MGKNKSTTFKCRRLERVVPSSLADVARKALTVGDNWWFKENFVETKSPPKIDQNAMLDALARHTIDLIEAMQRQERFDWIGLEAALNKQYPWIDDTSVNLLVVYLAKYGFIEERPWRRQRAS